VGGSSLFKQMKGKIIPLLLLTALAFYVVNAFISTRRESRAEISFKIGKIVIEVSSLSSFYDTDGNEISLWNFHLRGSGIIVGDSISKKACSDELHIFKKNKNKKYEYYDSVNSAGLFPLSWFCD